MSSRKVKRINELTDVRAAWNTIVAEHGADILHLDVTSTFEWTDLLWRSLLHKKDHIVLLLEKHHEPTGILPLYSSDQSIHHVSCRRISPITELYSGRNGFLLKKPLVEDLGVMFQYLYEELAGWDAFVLTLVDGSHSHILLSEIENRYGYHPEKIGAQTSPYIRLEGTWEDYFTSLPKKFRWNLRNGEKCLSVAGRVRYREYEQGSDLTQFLESVLQIERESWKETAGSSVTANGCQERLYRDLVNVAAEKGWLSGHVLELNEEPIAYVYGLLFNGVFYDLKESYKLKYKELSPGQTLKTFVIPHLYARNVSLYDYMGLCEPYKMRWTDKTYTRSTYMIYNQTVRGTVARFSGTVTSNLRRGARLLAHK